MSTQNSPQNETRPVYRLSESVPGDEPVNDPVYPCELTGPRIKGWRLYVGTEPDIVDYSVGGRLFLGYTHWRPSQPERESERLWKTRKTQPTRKECNSWLRRAKRKPKPPFKRPERR